MLDRDRRDFLASLTLPLALVAGCAAEAFETGEVSQADTVIEEAEPSAHCTGCFPHLAVGRQVDIHTSWQGLCELFGEYPCEEQPYRVEVACEGMDCELIGGGAPAFQGQGSITVAPLGTGSIQIRAILIHQETGESAELALPRIEIHEPDRVAIECLVGEEGELTVPCAIPPGPRPMRAGVPAGRLVRVFVRLMAGDHALSPAEAIRLDSNDPSFEERWEDAHTIDPDRYREGWWTWTRHYRLREPGLALEASYPGLESSLFLPINPAATPPLEHDRDGG